MIAGDSTVKLIQANARVPEDSRPVLLKAAALMRADPSFTVKLETFLSGGAGDGPEPSWQADMAARIEALEAVVLKNTAPASNTGKSGNKPATTVHQNCPDTLPMFADSPATDWQARAAAITLSTGEGKGRKLTAEGEALFREMMDAGESAPLIARTLGMAPQSVHYRLMKMKG
ncbi:hypothetical protein ACT6QG_02150 [Xanthobacter sp. TB0136]|uniref:hypothetical protein n=1 Tax=Xanthobacter sp. TB0136 TaxID=3459177 RepID=UPI004038FD7B